MIWGRNAPECSLGYTVSLLLCNVKLDSVSAIYLQYAVKVIRVYFMNVAYIRVSTVEQNESRQYAALEPYKVERYFSEKVSGKSTDRPQLQAMFDFVREGDTVYVCEFSRLARNTQDLLAIVEHLQQKGVKLISLKERLDTMTPTGKLMLTMIGAISEFERDLILERQKEGIAVAKKEGKYKGRKKIEIGDLPSFERLYAKYMRREISKAEMAKELGISRPTIDRLIAEYQD